MGIGQEELLQEVEQGEGGAQPMAQPWLLTTFGPAPLIHAGSTGLGGSPEGQQFLQPFRAVSHQLPRPLGRAEERAAGQHDIGEHT